MYLSTYENTKHLIFVCLAVNSEMPKLLQAKYSYLQEGMEDTFIHIFFVAN